MSGEFKIFTPIRIRVISIVAFLIPMVSGLVCMVCAIITQDPRLVHVSLPLLSSAVGVWAGAWLEGSSATNNLTRPES